MLPLLSACADRPSGFAPIVEKPPMAIDSDTLPNIYGMKWHRPI